ncbi:MAG: hypothetical protein V2J14_11795 [Erythrobacter sp.]|jgi:hypothetical protein|nr:hypothetical protein [Erythrobacter sp.]
MFDAERDERILDAADHQIVSKTFYRERIWKPARNVHADLPGRSSWLSALTLLYDYDGRLYFPDGSTYHPKDIDVVFNDPQNRWMSYFSQPMRVARHRRATRASSSACA